VPESAPYQCAAVAAAVAAGAVAAGTAMQQGVADRREASHEDQPWGQHQQVGTGQPRVPPFWHDLPSIDTSQNSPAERMACEAAVMMVWSGTAAAGQTGATMTTPDHLSNHHRNTLRQIFQHPVSHNIEWHAVVSLLEAIGSTVEQRGGKVAVTVGSETEYIDPPAHKDIDAQTVVDLRRMLANAGYGADAP
jgi:hypothetical protein